MRVPCVARWPGKIREGSTCRELCTTMDLMPTLAQLADAQPPADRIIDGHDIRPLLFGQPGAKSPYEAFYYYYLEQLQAVRAGRWKLYLPLSDWWEDFRRNSRDSPARLVDLVDDPGEKQNLADERPEVVRRLLALAEQARQDLGDVNRPGRNQRPAGHADHPTPRRLESP